MTEMLFLRFGLLLYSISYGTAHVGQPCNSIIKVCLASNSFCDDQNICRCKPTYPVSVSPHTCKKGKRYKEECRYTEECTYFDENAYCTQSPYSICECFPDFLYNEASQHCEELVDDFPNKSSNLIVPTAIGLSLAFVSVLCCCWILWRICKRQDDSTHWSFHPRSNTSSDPQQEPYNIESSDSFLRSSEALPTYDSALSLKGMDEECEPPPSYDEVVQSISEPFKS